MPKTQSKYIIHYQYEWEYDQSPRLLLHELYEQDGYLTADTDTIIDRYDFTDEDITELLATHDLIELGDFYVDDFLMPESMLTLELPTNAKVWVEALTKGTLTNV
jgi:hypothetical protein